MKLINPGPLVGLPPEPDSPNGEDSADHEIDQLRAAVDAGQVQILRLEKELAHKQSVIDGMDVECMGAMADRAKARAESAELRGLNETALGYLRETDCDVQTADLASAALIVAGDYRGAASGRGFWKRAAEDAEAQLTDLRARLEASEAALAQGVEDAHDLDVAHNFVVSEFNKMAEVVSAPTDKERIAQLEAEVAALRDALTPVASTVCSVCCPTTWKTNEGRKHSQICIDTRDVLASPSANADFEARVRADEREACAKVAENLLVPCGENGCPKGSACVLGIARPHEVAKAIRARGKT